jgi:hypothetical protein
MADGLCGLHLRAAQQRDARSQAGQQPPTPEEHANYTQRVLVLGALTKRVEQLAHCVSLGPEAVTHARAAELRAATQRLLLVNRRLNDIERELRHVERHREDVLARWVAAAGPQAER